MNPEVARSVSCDRFTRRPISLAWDEELNKVCAEIKWFV
jgi:hypothetical protein